MWRVGRKWERPAVGPGAAIALYWIVEGGARDVYSFRAIPAGGGDSRPGCESRWSYAFSPRHDNELTWTRRAVPMRRTSSVVMPRTKRVRPTTAPSSRSWAGVPSPSGELPVRAMLPIERYDDVTRLRMSTSVTRALGYEASAYVVRGVLVDTGFPAVARISRLDRRHAAESARSSRTTTRITPGTSSSSRAAASRVARRRPSRLRSPKPLWYLPARAGARSRRSVAGGAVRPRGPRASCPRRATRATITSSGTPSARRSSRGDLFLGVKVRVTHPWPREDVRAQIASQPQAVIALTPKRYFDGHRGLVHDAGRAAAREGRLDRGDRRRIEALIAAGDGRSRDREAPVRPRGHVGLSRRQRLLQAQLSSALRARDDSGRRRSLSDDQRWPQRLLELRAPAATSARRASPYSRLSLRGFRFASA